LDRQHDASLGIYITEDLTLMSHLKGVRLSLFRDKEVDVSRLKAPAWFGDKKDIHSLLFANSEGLVSRKGQEY
jgi:hypothetical protein